MKEARGLTPYIPPPRADSDARKWNGRTRGDHAPANTGASPVEGGVLLLGGRLPLPEWFARDCASRQHHQRH
jgi:hypothetical protein